ncbi:MAG: HAD-IB family hydrolase [Mycobacteriales bacterium]
MLREALSGKRILLTGVTGFVGEGLLARLLVEVPDAFLTVLVRPRREATAAERVLALAARPAFAGLADPAGALARVEVLAGELAELPALPAELDVVVHCAGDVSFDPPIDEAFATNVTGLANLIANISPTAHYVHVSTAFVSGRRRGAIAEAALEHQVDWRSEAAAAARARERAEDSSRSPTMLRRFQAEAARAHRGQGALVVAADAERRRQDWVRAQLVAAGTERARCLGWTDVYTFTKALGERVAEGAAGDRRVSIVRPSIIESALQTPFPGWIEGFKMAEPVILAYGRGELPEFPGPADGVADFIPVDHVVAALLAVAASPPPVGSPRYYHVGSSARNQLSYRQLYEHVRRYFTAHPLAHAARGSAPLPVWRFRGQASVARLLVAGERAHALADGVVSRMPRSEKAREAARNLDRQGARLSFLRRYYDLYRPYTETEARFDDAATLALYRSLPPSDQRDFCFDAAVIDWGHYLEDIHCPAVTAGMRELLASRRPRPALGLAQPSGQERTLAVFDMDGTLVASNVIESYLWLRLHGAGVRERLGEVRSLAAHLPGYLVADRRDRADFLRAVYRRYEGASVEELTALMSGELSSLVLAKLLPGALRRIRAHRSVGHRTVLVTGAVRALTAPIENLFDDVVAADLAVDAKGRATGFLQEPPKVGELRASWLRGYAASGGFDLSASYAYADSYSDLPMLRTVGNPVVVNPDVALYRAARLSRWPVESWPAAGSGRLEAMR